MRHSSSFACDACVPDELARLIAADAALAARWAAFTRRQLPAGASLLRQGEPAAQVWLITQGLVRLYFLSADGTERNKSFHAEGAWIGGGLPPHVAPSPYAIEALEPLSVVELPYGTLRECQREFPAIQPVLAEALSCTFARQSTREAELLLQDAETRYTAFVAAQAGLATRLPLHHVASYLGITPVALSRIRGRMGVSHPRRRSSDAG